MKTDDESTSTLNLEMPIHDGSRPVQDLLPDTRSRRIFGKLLNEQLRRQNNAFDEVKHWLVIELVLKAIIIGEYMEQQGILDIRKGIREFNDFQHQQLSLLQARRTPLVGFYTTR